jgi:hypothetical protein
MEIFRFIAFSPQYLVFNITTLKIRHAQHTARGPNVTRGNFLFARRAMLLEIFIALHQ